MDNDPCQNGGTCADSGNSITCICPNEWTGAYCESGWVWLKSLLINIFTIPTGTTPTYLFSNVTRVTMRYTNGSEHRIIYIFI